ncbi:MAG: ABC transporter ATP-binding protein [Muricomes sp.]
MQAIIINNLHKYYGNFHALKGVDLEIKKGEVFGFIGPNGSGKTTMLECTMGLRKFDSGNVHIFNYDVVKDHKKIVHIVGAQLQESELAKSIKVREAIQLQGAIFHMKPNVQELLEQFGLADKGNVYYSSLSGGQKQKLFILLAQLHNPEVLILDELSTGLDPVARSSMWNEILQLKAAGKTVLLSTHYMEEAEFVCDRVAVIYDGSIIDIGAPKELVNHLPFQYVVTMSKEDMKYTQMEREFYDVSMNDVKKVVIYVVNDNQKRKLLSIQKHGKDLDLSIRRARLDDYYQHKINGVKG